MSVGKVTIPQITNYMNKVSAPKQAKEFLDEIFNTIIAAVKAKSIMIDTLFQKDDPMGKNFVPYSTFDAKLTQMFGLKAVDAKLMAIKFMDKQGQVNYREFLIEYHKADKNKKLGIQPGFDDAGMTQGPDANTKGILKKVGNEVSSRGIALGKQFQLHEKGTQSLTIMQSQFFEVLKNAGISLMASEIKVLSQCYSTKDGSNNIYHRKFLEDLKLYGSNIKPISSLTQDQQKLFTALGSYLKKHNLEGALVQSLVNNDPKKKGYMQRFMIEESFAANKLTVTKAQFDVILGVLEQNISKESNYKQMLEYFLGVDQANSLYIQVMKQQGPAKEEVIYKFVMPKNPINPLNNVLG